jgi:TPR repeat protein
LTFLPEPGFSGFAGTLRYRADNGRGGAADGSVQIEVVASPQGTAALHSGTVQSPAPIKEAPVSIHGAESVGPSKELQDAGKPDTYAVAVFARGAAAELRGDISAARSFYTVAAKRNHVEAALNLGRLYDPTYLKAHLVGGAALGNEVISQQWYKRAADLGNAEAARLVKKE